MINWTEETKYMLNRYNLPAAEKKIVETCFEQSMMKFMEMDDRTCEKLCGYFTAWILGEKPKARLNYWMRKTGTTEAEINLWMTW